MERQDPLPQKNAKKVKKVLEILAYLRRILRLLLRDQRVGLALAVFQLLGLLPGCLLRLC